MSCSQAGSAHRISHRSQQLQKYNPEGLSTPQTYTHVVKSGKLLFIAGQVGSGPDGKVVGRGMREQLDQVLKNLAIALKSQGRT